MELLISVALIAILAAISIEVYAGALEKARLTRAIAEIRNISLVITDFQREGDLPESLDEVGWGGRLDPWGTPYRYLKFEFNKQGKVLPGPVRKDRFLVPLNSTYDLYSMGPDGRSVPPLTAADSRDDIIRAGDGAFIGIAEEY